MHPVQIHWERTLWKMTLESLHQGSATQQNKENVFTE